MKKKNAGAEQKGRKTGGSERWLHRPAPALQTFRPTRAGHYAHGGRTA